MLKAYKALGNKCSKSPKVGNMVSKNRKILLVGDGYIGQFLFNNLNKRGHDCTVISQAIKDNSEKKIERRFQDLTSSFLTKFTHILWFAGHSSVAKSKLDPIGAMRNNVVSLFELACKLPVDAKLVYASSASVYSGLEDGKISSIGDGLLSSVNEYDSSKKSFDLLIENIDFNAVGLRMGTVSGYSPKLRSELIFNSMNISALEKKLVNVTNKKSLRTILFLDDLLCIVLDQLKTQRISQKFLNAGSLNLSIGELANTIADFYGVPVIDHGDTGTYSFAMDFEPCSKNSLRPDLIQSQCLQFKKAYQK